MKRVFLVVGGSTLAVVLVLVITGLILPRRWHVQEVIAINAPAETIHRFTSDLRRWPEWADSTRHQTLEYAYSGPTEGVGAVREWRGQGGSHGSLTLVESDPKTGVRFESATNSETPNGHGALTYKPQVGFVEVAWEDHGELPPVIGGFLLDDMQKQLGFHFEEGLERLKRLAEDAANAAPSAP